MMIMPNSVQRAGSRLFSQATIYDFNANLSGATVSSAQDSLIKIHVGLGNSAFGLFKFLLRWSILFDQLTRTGHAKQCIPAGSP